MSKHCVQSNVTSCILHVRPVALMTHVCASSCGFMDKNLTIMSMSMSDSTREIESWSEIEGEFLFVDDIGQEIEIEDRGKKRKMLNKEEKDKVMLSIVMLIWMTSFPM